MSRRRRGGSFAKVWGKIKEVAKDSKIISKGLKAFGNPLGLADYARKRGYGKRRRGGAYVKFE